MVLRVNPRNGGVSTFVNGLPPINPAVGIGGAMDVAFIGQTARPRSHSLARYRRCWYGRHHRIDGPTSSTVIADIIAIANPPRTNFLCLGRARGCGGTARFQTDATVTLRVTLDGSLRSSSPSEYVPTGLSFWGRSS
jgi:hypothetical protein